MNFIRRIGKDEIYIKYVHQLVNVRLFPYELQPCHLILCFQMHLQAQNYVEAALTLKLHADLHEWDLNTFAPPMEDLGLPQQSQFHRKETLCLLILDYLGEQCFLFVGNVALIAVSFRERQGVGKRTRDLQGT
jgi:dedicator of cytokinesis protein 3